MTTKSGTYRVQLREWYVYDLHVVATSVDDAMKKAEAFYTSHRKPATKYLEEGMSATLQENSVRLRRQTTSQSGWAKARSASRDGQQDTASAV